MIRQDHVEDEFVLESQPFKYPKIFEGHWQDSIPSGFDAVMIDLDGRMQADLDWKKAREQALKVVEQGYALMWNMKMGLLNDLSKSLTDQSQFLSLTLALEHFRDSLWKEFKDQTLGLTFFRGSVDFSDGFNWDESQEQNLKNWLQEIKWPGKSMIHFSEWRQTEGQQLTRLYCRNVAIEYFMLLASCLPDHLSVYLFLDVSAISGSIATEMQMLNPERFERFYLALRNHRLPFDAIGWETPTAHGYSGFSFASLPSEHAASVGVCLPLVHVYQSQYYQSLEEGVLALQERSIVFKLISECHLTSQWDGLDYLLCHSASLSAQGKRKLQGFCAAGGTVISLGDPLGLHYEITLDDFLKLP